MSVEEKFIAYIDILGYKSMVEASERGTGFELDELRELTSFLGNAEDVEAIKKYGPHICPDSEKIKNDIDFKLTQLTDCVVVSSEVSPVGAINIISHCWSSVFKLLAKGVMCRGYITKGNIYHVNDGQFIGTGYQYAYSQEREVVAFKRTADEKGTPFVEIDKIIHEFIHTSTDECIVEMYERMVETKHGTSALFPFKKLSYSFMIRDDFDPVKEKENNNIMRQKLLLFKSKVLSLIDYSNESAVSKSEHYVFALDRQIELCDKIDKNIDCLCGPATLPIQDIFK